MKISKVLIVTIFATIEISQAFNYCTLCSDHVACLNPQGTLSPSCPSNATVIKFTPKQVNLLVNEHNNFRNLIASGKLDGFSPAVKMKEVSWDHELAKLASLNVKKCEFEHDKCFTTSKYKFPGQNLYTYSSYPACPKVDEQIKNGVKSWFEEYKDTSPTDLASYPQFTPNMIGHFTQIVKDDSHTIGCAMIQYTQDGWCQINLACNYAKTNMINDPIYVAGTKASQCSKVSERYSGLCSAK